MIYFSLMMLCFLTGCLNGHGKKLNNKLLPIPDVNFDKDHDSLPDGIDPSPLLADIPEIKLFEFEAGIKSNSFEAEKSKFQQNQVLWGFNYSKILQYLRLPQQHSDSLIPINLRPMIQIDLANNLKFWSKLAGVYSAEYKKHDDEFFWQAQIGLQGPVQDKYLMEEFSWQLLDEKKYLVAKKQVEPLSMVFHQTEKHIISTSKLISEKNTDPDQFSDSNLFPRYLQIEFGKSKMYRNGKVLELNSLYQQLFKNNVTVWIITDKNQTPYSFAAGLSLTQMLQQIDPLLKWQEDGPQLHQFISLRQEIGPWDNNSNFQDDLDSKGRWDVVLKPEIDHEENMLAGTHVLLVYSTVKDHRINLLQVNMNPNRIISSNDVLNIGQVVNGEKYLWQIRGAVALPEYDIIENYVVPAIVDYKIDGEVGNRGRFYPLHGYCGLRYRQFHKMLNKDLDFNDFTNIKYIINDRILETHEGAIYTLFENGQFWLALNAKQEGRLEIALDIDRFKQPLQLGFIDFADCAHRFKGNNFRFAENIDVGPWRNRHNFMLTFEINQ